MNSKNLDNVIKNVCVGVKDILGSPLISELSLADDLEQIIARLQASEFRLAVVGEFSSGKSTFLNALIKRDLLKHGAKETTATITEIQNVGKNEDESFDAFFTDGSVKKNIPLDELEKFTSTSSTAYDVAKDILKVRIKACVLATNSNVVFIDTPGLNGVADNHREKTIKEIKRAHACIYLMPLRGFAETDAEFIKLISQYQHNVIFVQNFIDDLNTLENESAQSKCKEQKAILDSLVKKEKLNLKFSLVGVSAKNALLGQDKNLKHLGGVVINQEFRDKLYKESLFDSVLDAIRSLVTDNEKNEIQKKDAIRALLEILNRIKEVLSSNESQFDSMQNFDENNFLEKTKNIIKKNKDVYIRNINNFVDVTIEDIKKDCFENISSNQPQIYKSVEDQVTTITDKNSLDSFIKTDQVNTIVNTKLCEIDKEKKEQIAVKLQNLLDGAVQRIQQYTMVKVEDQKTFTISTERNFQKYQIKTFEHEEDDINNLKIRLNRYEFERNDLKIQDEKCSDEISKLKKESASHESILTSQEREYRTQLSRLGNEPCPEQKCRSVKRYVDRGGLGIVQFFLGSKEVWEDEYYYDYSKQHEWEAQKNQIENDYAKQRSVILCRERELASKLNRLCQERENIVHEMDDIENNIRSIQNNIVESKKLLETMKKRAESEFLNKLKRALMEDVENQLGNALETMKKIYGDLLKRNGTAIKKRAIDLFDISFNSKMEKIESRMKRFQNGEMSNEKRLLNKINEIKNMVEA